jgi:hypothetical protein
VTLSFWVRSSLTGTFGGVIQNSASDRSYPFTYTINAANTWEYETITIAGDTSGTWLTTNGIGVQVKFGLGVGSTFSGTAGAWASANFISATGATSVVGTNGATFYITGVQLEVGSTATSFDYRPYGTELALCQRYYFKIGLKGSAALGSGVVESATLASLYIKFPTTMRASPTLSFNALGAADTAARTVSSIDSQSSSNDSAYILVTTGSGLTTGRGAYLYCSSDSGFLAGSIEL